MACSAAARSRVRVVPRFTIGAYGSYGIAKTGESLAPAYNRGSSPNCDSGGWSCSSRVIHAGLQATWRFQVASPSPWIGVGAGYEWMDAVAKYYGSRYEVKARGFELVRLMAGFDLRVGGGLAVGPYLQWGMGRYHHLENRWIDLTYHGSTGSTAGKPSVEAMHFWYTVGLRGTFESLGDGAAGIH